MAEEREDSVQEIESSLDALESQLRAQIARARAGGRAMLVIGIIVIAIIFGYMTWLTKMVRDVADPVGLLDIAEAKVVEHKEEALKNLEAALIEKAPEYVALATERIESAIPLLREQARKAATAAIDLLADELEAKIDGVVAEVIAMHEEELRPLIETAAAEGGAEKLEEAFEESMEILIGKKLDEVLLQFDRALMIVDLELDRLDKPLEDLSLEQVMLKEMVTTILYAINDIVSSADASGTVDLDKISIPGI